MELFRQSVRICRAGGETMQPMTLLPLAELHCSGQAEEADYTMSRKVLQRLQGSDDLCAEHFNPLFSYQNPVDLLIAVHRLKAVFFPFSYR
jgi:hypothetical protein